MKVEWIDGKLFDPKDAYNSQKTKQTTLNPVFLKKIWKPDVFFDEIVEVRKPSLMAKTRQLKFSPGSGYVSYIIRLVISKLTRSQYYLIFNRTLFLLNFFLD